MTKVSKKQSQPEQTKNEMFHDQSENEMMTQAEYDALIELEDTDETFEESLEQSLDLERLALGDEIANKLHSKLESKNNDETDETMSDHVVLPDIVSVDLGSMKTKSARIRYLIGLGYKRNDIANHLNIRYQHVFNVEHMQPKRAAREDHPKDLILRDDIVHGDQGIDNPSTLKDLGVLD